MALLKPGAHNGGKDYCVIVSVLNDHDMSDLMFQEYKYLFRALY